MGAPRLRARAAASTIEVLPIPDSRPPLIHPDRHDRELDDGERTGYVQGALRIPVTDPPETTDPMFGPQPTASRELADPQAWAQMMIRMILEAMDGRRSPHQLTRWVTPTIKERIARRGITALRHGIRSPHPPVVRRLLSCQPTDGVAEVSAVVQYAGRVRALAVRLSGMDGRWLVTAFELG